VADSDNATEHGVVISMDLNTTTTTATPYETMTTAAAEDEDEHLHYHPYCYRETHLNGALVFVWILLLSGMFFNFLYFSWWTFLMFLILVADLILPISSANLPIPSVVLLLMRVLTLPVRLGYRWLPPSWIQCRYQWQHQIHTRLYQPLYYNVMVHACPPGSGGGSGGIEEEAVASSSSLR
jgi:hypothetical protein